MVPYIYMIGLCHSVAILRHKCRVRWLRFHFKRILITGIGQYTFILPLPILRMNTILFYSYHPSFENSTKKS